MASSSAPAKPSLRLCVYNYKGGAAKTTIVVNTAAAVAHPEHGNKKTLLIDLDPQCNSTQFYHDDNERSGGGLTLSEAETQPPTAASAAAALAHGLAAGDAEPKLMSDVLHPQVEAADMDALISDPSMKSPLYRLMHTLFVDQDASGVREMVQNEGLSLLHQVNAEFNPNSGLHESVFGQNFWLLEGDASIAEFDRRIADALSNFFEKAFIKQYGLISYMMMLFTEELGFDVILIDCSPSNSALNKVAALACDYILPPCMAALYSAGSVAGLLTQVLPGETGWLGLHEKITERWRDKDFKPKPDVATLSDWLLPPTPPQLLPIIISNYTMGDKKDDLKAELIVKAKKKGRRVPPPDPGAGDPRVMKLMQSQFVYTIMNFVNVKCKYIHGNNQHPPPGPLVRFRENHNQRVINFAESVPIAMPVAETTGRSFVELEIYDFLEYKYGAQRVADMLKEAEYAAEEEEQKKKKKKRKADPNIGMIDYGQDGRDFTAEVEKMKQSYSTLSAWLVYLLEEKRKKVSQTV